MFKIKVKIWTLHTLFIQNPFLKHFVRKNKDAEHQQGISKILHVTPQNQKPPPKKKTFNYSKQQQNKAEKLSSTTLITLFIQILQFKNTPFQTI